MVVCRYFLQGRCKYGTQCVNEHPGVPPGAAMSGGATGPRPGFHRNQSITFNESAAPAPSPFPSAAPTGFRPPGGAGRGRGGGRGGPARPHYQDTPASASFQHQQQPGQNIRPEDVIYHDLVEVHMQWPLGCYGLNCSWESGDNVIRDDHSPEELRCEAYAQWRSVGNIQQYERTLGTVLDGRRRLIGDLKANLSRAVAMARTPRTYRLATEQAQKSAVPAAAPVPLTAQKGLHPQTQAPHQHHQHVAAAPAPASTTVAPLPGSVYSSQDFDSFTFGDIPELPPS